MSTWKKNNATLGKRGGSNGPQAGATSSLPQSHLLTRGQIDTTPVLFSFVYLFWRIGRWKRPAEVPLLREQRFLYLYEMMISMMIRFSLVEDLPGLSPRQGEVIRQSATSLGVYFARDMCFSVECRLWTTVSMTF